MGTAARSTARPRPARLRRQTVTPLVRPAPATTAAVPTSAATVLAQNAAQVTWHADAHWSPAVEPRPSCAPTTCSVATTTAIAQEAQPSATARASVHALCLASPVEARVSTARAAPMLASMMVLVLRPANSSAGACRSTKSARAGRSVAPVLARQTALPTMGVRSCAAPILPVASIQAKSVVSAQATTVAQMVAVPLAVNQPHQASRGAWVAMGPAPCPVRHVQKRRSVAWRAFRSSACPARRVPTCVVSRMAKTARSVIFVAAVFVPPTTPAISSAVPDASQRTMLVRPTRTAAAAAAKTTVLATWPAVQTAAAVLWVSSVKVAPPLPRVALVSPAGAMSSSPPVGSNSGSPQPTAAGQKKRVRIASQY